jgi:hypothetical protein
LRSIGQHRSGWQRRQAKQHGRDRQPKAHQNPAKELEPRLRLIDETLTNVTGR